MDNIDEVFPVVNSGVIPFGSRVVVQVRRPERKTRSGIILIEETREATTLNTQIAKVVAIGALSFRNRTDLTPWPEGNWCDVGDFVRIPQFGGSRFMRKLDGDDIMFVIFNDLDIIGKVTDDPATIVTYI